MRKDFLVTVAGLLHDIGKVVRRAEGIGTHQYAGFRFLEDKKFPEEIINAVRYHHKNELKKAELKDDDISYLVYVADNIASAFDRRYTEEQEENGVFNEKTPLKSIFNLLNDNSSKLGISQIDNDLKSKLCFPVENLNLSQGFYKDIKTRIEKNLISEDICKSKINSIIELMESTTSSIPSCTNSNDTNDISLYDHSKLTAAIALCIYNYLKNNNITEYKTKLFINEKEFYSEKAFCLASFDISGIQKFIYSVVPEKALKQLRARSNYLELLTEFLVDELLISMELTRANLIYNSGGHCYMLIPNTQHAKDNFAECLKSQNKWFLKFFKTDLYVAGAYQECSAYELQNTDGGESVEEIIKNRKTCQNYKNIYKKLSQKISLHKMKRYDADEIQLLNSEKIDSSRECKVCGCSSRKLKDNKCEICVGFEEMGKKIMDDDIYFVFTKNKMEKGLNLPFFGFKTEDCYMQILNKENTKALIKDNNLIRFYSKNSSHMGKEYGCNIFVGDYRAVDESGKPLSFEGFVERCKGIHRLGVLRADVDNLGQAFISGFERSKDDKVNYEYVTLSRTSTLSKNLAMFFKYYINEILSNKQKYSYLSFSDEQTASNKRNLAIVYSGGDDIFIVGSYNEIIEAAYDLRQTFKKYTQNTLTISAGISIYKSGYPISRMAEETGKLENCSKNNPNKDSVTLFTDDGESTFKWDDFKNNVIDEKLRFLESYFERKKAFSPASGSSFLYNVLNFLKQNKSHRLAYLLSRVVKDNDKRSEFDSKFINNIYEWSKNEKNRRELIMAITLYIYLNRKEG